MLNSSLILLQLIDSKLAHFIKNINTRLPIVYSTKMHCIGFNIVNSCIRLESL